LHISKIIIKINHFMLKNIFLSLLLCLSGTVFSQIKDRQFPLPPHSIRLSGYLENDIQNSMTHWNKGAIPYTSFVDFFRNGRAQFALGEMWGKAVRSGSMYYRYTQDTELKKILDETVRDLLTTQQPNGSISCSPADRQPGGTDGDIWERKYVMLGLLDYYQLIMRR
jgi:hypothetical protein